MTDDGNELAERRVGAGLGIGILLLPLVFAWFTLTKGYSKVARGVSFGWMALVVLLWTMSASGQKDQAASSASGEVASEADAPSPGAVDIADTREINDRFSDKYKYVVNEDHNFLIGICEKPEAIEICSREYLMSLENGGAYWEFTKDGQDVTIYARNGQDVIDKALKAHITYLSSENEADTILAVQKGIDFDADCYFRRLYRKSGGVIFKTELSPIGKCSQMAKEGSASSAAEGERKLNYE